MENRNNPDFELLRTAANYIKEEFFQEEISDWENSPFKWIKTLSSGSKGKLGKRLVFQWCALKQLSVDRCPDSEADMLINGHRVEIKFSTLWQNGIYKFQQIRDQNYEFIICLGISPFNAHCWIIDKPTLHLHVIGHTGQHTGLRGRDTAWIQIYPDNPLPWIASLGGSLEQAYSILQRLSRR